MDDCDWTDMPCTSYSVTDLTEDEDQNHFLSSESINYEDQALPEEAETTSVPNRQATDNEDISNDAKNASDHDIYVEGAKKPKTSKEQEKESCPICLSAFVDRSFLDQCFHSFCFCCILQWCEVVQTCPLCKSGFASVIHKVKSMQDYEQYIIEKKDYEGSSSNDQLSNQSYDERGFNEHGQRFRYRTTRSTGNQVEITASRVREMHHSLTVPRRTDVHSETRQRSRISWGNEATVRDHRQRSRRRIKGLERRRQVYAFNLRATAATDHLKERSRNITAQFFKTYQGCTHRLIPWLSRDLKVLLGNNETEVNFLIEFILSLITRIDMENVDFAEELKPFLLQTTNHFVHELIAFAKSRFDMIAYDEVVVYPWPEEGARNVLPRVVDIASNETIAPGNSVDEITPLSRCPWTETPARLGTENNTAMNIGNRLSAPAHVPIEIIDLPEHTGTVSMVHGISEANGNVLDVGESCNCTRGDAKVNLKSKNVADRTRHLHIHKHIHKHRHRHIHKHRHKHKKRSKRKEGETVCSEQQSYKDDNHPRENYTKTKIQVEDTQEHDKQQSLSPNVENMQKEIDELNMLIQQYEDELLKLDSRKT